MSVSEGKFSAFRLQPGSDLRRGIIQHAQELEFSAAAMLTCVGSLRTASMRLADESIPKPYDGPFEIVSVVGTVGGGECHLHLSIADATGRVLGGHMREGCVVHTTAEIVMVSMTGLMLKRVHDPHTKFKELVVISV